MYIIKKFSDWNVHDCALPRLCDWSKLKALADNKLYVTEKLKFVLGSLENIMGKKKMLG